MGESRSAAKTHLPGPRSARTTLSPRERAERDEDDARPFVTNFGTCAYAYSSGRAVVYLICSMAKDELTSDSEICDQPFVQDIVGADVGHHTRSK